VNECKPLPSALRMCVTAVPRFLALAATAQASLAAHVRLAWSRAAGVGYTRPWSNTHSANLASAPA